MTAASSGSGSLELCGGRIPSTPTTGCFRIGILRTARKSLRVGSSSNTPTRVDFPSHATHQCTRFLYQREIRMLVRSSPREPFFHSGAKTLWGRRVGQTGLRRRRVVYLALLQQRLLREVSTASSKMRERTKRLKGRVFVQLEASDHAKRRALNWVAVTLGGPGQSIRRFTPTMKVVHRSSPCKSNPHMHRWQSRR